jgi:DNA-binding LacI/PurR family transcriptional regulator
MKMEARQGSRERVTAKQVAARARVSATTVSLVLNRVAGASISEETRERVRAAAEELGYVASAAARTLVSGRSDTVGLVINHTELLRVDAFIPQLLYGLEQVARAHGLHVRVEGMEAVSGPDPYAQLFRARHIDGLVVLDPRHSEEGLARLIGDGYPIVTMGTVHGSDPIRVVSDNIGGMRTLTEHLLRLGHTRIAHLTFSPTGFVGTDQRLEGYRQALAGAGLPLDAVLVAEVGYSAASGFEAMQRLLARTANFSAVTCGNDTVAIGAMAALSAAGRRVPKDVAVVGFDDIPTAAYQNPPLTTMRTDPVASGRIAMTMLTQLIAGQTPRERVVEMPSTLVVRRSCGAPVS